MCGVKNDAPPVTGSINTYLCFLHFILYMSASENTFLVMRMTDQVIRGYTESAWIHSSFKTCKHMTRDPLQHNRTLLDYLLG